MAIAIARIQAQQARRESEENLRAILDAAHESITLFAADGTILAANTVAASRLGRIPSEVVGHHFSKFVPAQLVESRQARMRDVVSMGHSVRFEDEQNGIIFDHNFCPIFEGIHVKRVATFSQDITKRKQAEQALSRVAEELSRSNQELEQFASVASHDLQEPLRAVSRYVSLLEERMRDQLDAKALQHIDGAIQGVERMQRLITDLLALSRVGTQGKAFALVDLQTVLDHAVQSLSVNIRETGAQITHDPLPVLTADAGQLVQLFQNLIANAIKFRGERTPEIHVSAQPQAGTWLITVRDNGIGIEPQYFARIFLIFQRLHKRTQYPGTGIGLAICKKIIERHGGAIRVESRPGEGSTFFFTLPSKGTP
ncbi:MAG: sensor histidine kinase [Armatimonadota bacterium]